MCQSHPFTVRSHWVNEWLFCSPFSDLPALTSALGFKAMVNPLFACFTTCLQFIPQSHLKCDTCWLLGVQHLGPALSNPHVQAFEFCHFSCLIRWIEQKRTRYWTQVPWLAVRHSNHYTRMFLCLCEAVIESYLCMGHSVSHSNHYTRMFSVLVWGVIESYSCMGDSVSHSNHYTRMFSVFVWGCNWILFMHGWFCQPLQPLH